ncbi:MAG TPA: hypothetical protein VK208_23565 [Pyrinomonadaceae bacterium]|nr:hypothetical protein [Pyrinomonadaceae bacterium]
MSELNEAWTLGLAEAEARARAKGRADIAEYLALRSSNDLTRSIAGDWLLQMFANAAGEANRAGAAIQISRDDAHRFKVDNASMVGSRLSLGKGVRMLRVAAGWPRTPRDGVIRGGGLACGHITHVGIKPADEELRLIVDGNGRPSWIVILKDGRQVEARELQEADIKHHLAILLGD